MGIGESVYISVSLHGVASICSTGAGLADVPMVDAAAALARHLAISPDWGRVCLLAAGVFGAADFTGRIHSANVAEIMDLKLAGS